MGTLNKIIVAMDNSKISEEVLKRALLLADEKNCSIAVVHAISAPWFDIPDYFGGKEIKDINETDIREKIEHRVQKLSQDTNIKCSVLVSKGDIADIIIYEAKHQNAQMIILGAHSKKDLKTKKFGSIAQKVTQNSHLPVLVVKTPAVHNYKNILVPSDLSDFSKKSILFTKNIFKQGVIKLVYIYQQPVDVDMDFYDLSFDEKVKLNEGVELFAKEDLKNFEKDVDIEKGDFIESSTTIENDLTNFIEKNGNDLVIIGSHGVKNITSFLFGSTASFLMKESPSDILVYVP